MTINRKLKNLYNMYRFNGWQIFETFDRLHEAKLQRNKVMYEVLDKKLTSLVQKYDMLKQILIER